jgi:hypothetical protein
MHVYSHLGFICHKNTQNNTKKYKIWAAAQASCTYNCFSTLWRYFSIGKSLISYTFTGASWLCVLLARLLPPAVLVIDTFDEEKYIRIKSIWFQKGCDKVIFFK